MVKKATGFLIFLLVFIQLAIAGATDTLTAQRQDTLVVKVIPDSVKNSTDSNMVVAHQKTGKDSELTPESILSYFSAAKIFYSIIILLLSFVFVRIFTKILNIWGEVYPRHRVTIKGLIPLMRIVIWVGAFSFILVSIIKPPLATILTFSASIGVAVGFASQDLLKNIFGGITIIFDKPFKVGDKVKIGEYYGEIVKVGLRSTRLVTPDDNLVSVPNAEIMNKQLANANAGEDNCQVVTDFYLPLHADIQKFKALAIDAASVSRYVYLNKPIVVLFEQVTEDHRVYLRMRVKAYVNDTRDEFKFKSDITEQLSPMFYPENSI